MDSREQAFYRHAGQRIRYHRLQRQRTKGYRIPPNAIYVGRPSPWGNPFAWNDNRAPWMALAVGERADAEGRRSAAVKLYRWWMEGTDPKAFPMDTEDHGGPAIEYTNGVVRSFRSMASGMGAMMWLREPLPVPHPPDLAPLRGHDLACWCPLDQPCHADVLLEMLA